MSRTWLGLLALVAACGGPPPEVRTAYRDLIAPPESCRASAPASLSPAQMRRDYAVLERALRRGYAGFEQAAAPADCRSRRYWAAAWARAAVPTLCW